MKTRPILIGVTALLVATSILPVSAATVSLISASSHPTKMPWVGSMKNFVVPEISKRLAASGSTTKISWTELYGVGHFKAHDGLESVEKGLAHLAWVFYLQITLKARVDSSSFLITTLDSPRGHTR